MAVDHKGTTLAGCERIEEVIHLFHQEETPRLLMAVCLAVREHMMREGHLLFPAHITQDSEGAPLFFFQTTNWGELTALAAFTSEEELQKGPPCAVVSQFIDPMLHALLQREDMDGLVINPWGEAVFLDKEDLTVILHPGIERFMM